MSIITNKGAKAKESANKKKIDYKKIFIKLKDGDSIRVRIPSAEDYVEYKAHGDFDLGVYTQPCIAPTSTKCAYCVASKVEGFDALYAKSRYLFAFYDIDERMLRFFDASKAQATKLIADIEQYAENLTELAFTFKRTGEKSATNYSVSPILKLKAEDQDKFDAFKGDIQDSQYEEALHPRSFAEQVEELRKIGFPVNDIFGDNTTKSEETSEPITEPLTKEF